MDLTEEEIKSIRELHDLVDNEYYYEIFNISPSASEEDIKTAYYSMSRQWHPDRFFRRETGKYGPLLEKIFIGINQAFKTLTTIEDRSLFDKQYISNQPKEGLQEVRRPDPILSTSLSLNAICADSP